MRMLLEHIKNLVLGFIGGIAALVAAVLVVGITLPKRTLIDPVTIMASLSGFGTVLFIFSLGFYLMLARKLAKSVRAGRPA